jgi:hypothetical protein
MNCSNSRPHRAAFWVVAVAAALLTVGLSAGSAGAQGTSGSLSGIVEDPSGAPVAGAVVSVVSWDTGRGRTAVTDARGVFRLTDLSPGIYTVTTADAGRGWAARQQAVIQLGQDARAALVLSPIALVESVAVTATAAAVDARTTAAGGVVSRRQIADLPLNGRSFLQLATLQPGVTVSRATGRDFTSGFGQTQLSVAGARPEHTTYLLDGTAIPDISDKAPSSVSGLLLGVDTVREFRVLTHGYAAEFGRAAGGIVSMVTRSGTNAWTGSAFAFHRDSALDARNYFDVGTPPAFRRDQVGGSIGGPIRRNRVFLFATTELLSERRSVTRVARLPDQAAHDGLLPDGAGQVRAVGVHPNARPYLDLLFPGPSGPSFGDGTAEHRHAHRDPTDEWLGVVRLDWQPGESDTVTFRYSHDTSDATTSLDHPLFLSETGSRTRYLTVQHQRLFGARAVGNVRLALNRTGRDDDVRPTVDIPAGLLFTADPHFGAITITGVTLAGSTGAIPAEYRQRIVQVAPAVTWTQGPHLLKAGLDWQHYAFGGVSHSRYGGEFRFRSLEEFLRLRRSATAQADRFTGSLPASDTAREMRQHYVALFAQDDWTVGPTLTVTAGVRYERVTIPVERHGRVAGLVRIDDLEAPIGGVTPGAPFFEPPSPPSVAPRIGAAWAPRPDTIVRAAYGLFYQPLTVSYYRATSFRVFPYFAGVDIRQPAVFGPGIQGILAQPTPGSIQRRSEFIAYDAKQPFTQQWHGLVQRRLGASAVADIGYLGSRGHHLPFYGDPNSAPAERLADGSKRVIPGAGLRYPSWGRVRTRINVARSSSHYVVLGVRREAADGLALQGAYTYGHSRDTWSGGLHGSADFDNGAGSATDWWDPEAEYGPSNFDVRHTLVVNGVWALPWGRQLDGLARWLGHGWHVAGLLHVASGLPFTPFIGFDRAGDLQSDADQIQKPDQTGPVTYLKQPDAWFDAGAFALPAPGYYGNARRNSLRGPGLKVVDLALFKDLALRRSTIQVRLEAFNLFNWTNFGIPDATALFNPDGSRRTGVGRITTTATPARQVQLGARWSF